MVLKKKDKRDRLYINIGNWEPELKEYIYYLRGRKELTQYGLHAFNFYYDYQKYTKGFFIRLIEYHFDLIKYLVRKVGQTKKTKKVVEKLSKKEK